MCKLLPRQQCYRQELYTIFLNCICTQSVHRFRELVSIAARLFNVEDDPGCTLDAHSFIACSP